MPDLSCNLEKTDHHREPRNLYARRRALELIYTFYAAHPDAAWYELDNTILTQMGIDANRRIFISGTVYFPGKERCGYSVIFFHKKKLIPQVDTSVLQLLDVLVLLKNMSEVEVKQVLINYKSVVRALPCNKTKELVSLARGYAPVVRAILALILFSLSEERLCLKLVETINPVVFKKYRATYGPFIQ